MRNRLLSLPIVLLMICPAFTQQKAAVASSPSALELPARLTQKIQAGKTAVGTRVEAKLVVATLLHGRVVPADAILSGHVEESQAKTHEQPSRLRIVIDSVHWKDGEMPLDACLTNMYHPVSWNTDDDSDDLQNGLWSTDRRQRRQTMMKLRTQGHMDTRPADQRTDIGNSFHVSAIRVPMPHVVPVTVAQGGMTLTSTARNIKLDKDTVYGFEGSSPLAAASH